MSKSIYSYLLIFLLPHILLGLDNPKCKTVILIGVYYGLTNYHQCSSRSARERGGTSRSIFIASNEAEYRNSDHQFTSDFEAKKRHLESYGGIKDVDNYDLNHMKNDSLRSMVGPFTRTNDQDMQRKCIKCSLRLYFDNYEDDEVCNCNISPDNDIFCKTYFEMQQRTYIKHCLIKHFAIDSRYESSCCPFFSCDGKSCIYLTSDDGTAVRRKLKNICEKCSNICSNEAVFIVAYAIIGVYEDDQNAEGEEIDTDRFRCTRFPYILAKYQNEEESILWNVKHFLERTTKLERKGL